MQSGYLSIKEFSKKKGISELKVKKMAPYISGSYKCHNCGVWNIPQDAIPLYVPDKRFYKKCSKNYCYVLDAICYGFLLDNRVDGINISEQECKTIVGVLKEKGKIILKNGYPKDSLNYRDYIQGIEDWGIITAKQKTEVVIEILKAIGAVASVAYIAMHDK